MNEATTAVVLAAGRGSRMRRDAESVTLETAQADVASRGIKGMMPDDRGRPFLDHVLASLAEAGIRDACIVIGPDHDVIRAHYSADASRRIRVAFSVQREPTGTADGLLAAEEWIAGRDVIVVNADNIYPVDAIRALVTLGSPGLVAFDRATLIRESNIDPEKIAAFAALTLRDDGTLAGVVEKPGERDGANALNAAWISMNIWRFDSAIFAACRDVPLSPRGEHELPLAVDLAIRRGMTLRAVCMHAGVLDLSNRGDVAPVARLLGTREVTT